jgi:hypothetical protein
MSVDDCFAGTNAKVFSLDVEKYTVFHHQEYLYSFIVCPAYWPITCLVIPCEYQNIRDRANAIRIGVTETHLIYCREKVKTCWRLSCCDEGKIVREIPLEQITDVIVTEPAGGCCPPNILYKVSIETPGQGGFSQPDVKIDGLTKDDAYKLRALVMKRKSTRKAPKRMSRV